MEHHSFMVVPLNQPAEAHYSTGSEYLEEKTLVIDPLEEDGHDVGGIWGILWGEEGEVWVVDSKLEVVIGNDLVE